MSVSQPLEALEAARAVLLASTGAADGDRAQLEAAPPLSAGEEADAIKLLDAAGAVDAVLDSDFSGNRRWRVRAVTSAGHDVARLIRNDHVWSRLKRELAIRPDPVGELVRCSDETVALA